MINLYFESLIHFEFFSKKILFLEDCESLESVKPGEPIHNPLFQKSFLKHSLTIPSSNFN